MSLIEKQLLQKAQKYDQQALEEIYDRYSDQLYAYADRRLGNPQKAEDLVSETFSRFLHAIKNGGGPEDHLKAYLYRMIHNLITDVYRREPPPPLELNEDCYSESSSPSALMDLKVKGLALRSVLRRLTPDQQQVILLRYVEELSNAEIAQVMEKTEGAVKSLHHRAIASLKRLLDKQKIRKDEVYETNHV